VTKELFFDLKGYFDFSLKEKNKKAYLIAHFLGKMIAFGVKNQEVFNKYYKELVATTGDIKWADANKYVKRFKVFGRAYVYWRAEEYKVYEWGKRVYSYFE